ncbi:MAG TPA: hypothetical protein VMD59_16635, partial [Acidimicrobiales bacterium]|nr:hypothetical protein [Acidimicrobiales bacterium]
NGAAAVLLVLATLAAGRSVVVSRGELVEIGGGFRIPEVLEASGARLVEVGTTNRTRLSDYERAIASRSGANGVGSAACAGDGAGAGSGAGAAAGDGAGAGSGAVARGGEGVGRPAPGGDGGGGSTGEVAVVLKVHPSNYRLVGFTESVPVSRLARLGPPVVADIGSGLLDAAAPWLGSETPPWLEGEPAARQTLAAGASVVTFSGDKLLGGPQAGIVAGRAAIVGACARHPLMRALRPGNLVLEAMQEVLLAYLRRDGRSIPFWRMATAPLPDLFARAEAIAALCGGRVVATASVAGGGSLPGRELASAGVALDGDLSAGLRAQDPPVVARVHDATTICDLRTVDPDDDLLLAAALRAVASAGVGGEADGGADDGAARRRGSAGAGEGSPGRAGGAGS